ncbi:MAG: hypothetical protein NTY23_02250 [Chloroflexi bacterium]|nr:hypothetical protein [Chloroflexota bacterium]
MYDRFSPALYRYAWRLTGNDELAEECVAETFGRYLAPLHAGAGPTQNVWAYLYRVGSQLDRRSMAQDKGCCHARGA